MVAASLAAFLASGYWLIAGSQSDSVETTELNTSTLSTSQAKGTSTVSTMLPEAQSSGSPAQHDAGASQSDQSGRPKAEPFRPTQADYLIPPADRPLQGVAVAHDSLTPEELVRVQQNQRMAVLSSRMGRQSAHAFAHPIAVAGEAPASVDGAQSQAGADIHRAPLELPPLMIGPQSLRLAAANGDASAQFEVAARFAEGKGVPQSFEQAALWYQRAAAQGLAVAQYRLATLYERGLGEQADPARARVWYQRAAEHGNVKAMHNLAVLSAGRDGTPDYATAAHWFTEAAERGLADSQYNLGILYESGRGVPKEPLTAYRWYALAAASGDKEAERRRDLLGSKIGPQLRKPVEEEVSKWRPRVVDRLANDSHAAGEAWKLRASGSSTN